jgi:hypothetical protein
VRSCLKSKIKTKGLRSPYTEKGAHLHNKFIPKNISNIGQQVRNVNFGSTLKTVLRKNEPKSQVFHLYYSYLKDNLEY